MKICRIECIRCENATSCSWVSCAVPSAPESQVVNNLTRSCFISSAVGSEREHLDSSLIVHQISFSHKPNSIRFNCFFIRITEYFIALNVEEFVSRLWVSKACNSVIKRGVLGMPTQNVRSEVLYRASRVECRLCATYRCVSALSVRELAANHARSCNRTYGMWNRLRLHLASRK